MKHNNTLTIRINYDIIHNNANKISKFLEQENYNETITFKNFLNLINVEQLNYIKAIQLTITKVTIFLKRYLTHIWNNSFAKKILEFLEANTDVKLVLNAHVVEIYCLYVHDYSIQFYDKKL